RCLPPTDVDFEFIIKKTGTGAVDKPQKEVEKVAETVASEAPQSQPAFAPGQGGGILEPVKWSMSVRKLGEGKFEVESVATIDDGWSVYSQYLESEDGPVATSFTYEVGEHFNLLGKNTETGNLKKAYDKFFDMEIAKFNGSATFTQQIEITDELQPVYGFLTFMTCDDRQCLLEVLDFFIEAASLQAYVGQEATGRIAALES